MTEWTPEMVNRVRALVAENNSSGQIAYVLNTELGLELSRNAIIGIMHRRGITGRTVTRDEQAERAKSNGHAARKRQRIRRLAQFRAPPQSVVAPAPLPIARLDAVPYSRQCSLMDLNASTCRFPIGDVGEPGFHFCGALPAAGEVYCGPHCSIAFNYVPRIRRR